jgi:hypothetical protein
MHSLAQLQVQELKRAREEREENGKARGWGFYVQRLLVLVLVFICAFAAVWVVNEVNYRGGLPTIRFIRRYIYIPHARTAIR